MKPQVVGLAELADAAQVVVGSRCGRASAAYDSNDLPARLSGLVQQLRKQIDIHAQVFISGNQNDSFLSPTHHGGGSLNTIVCLFGNHHGHRLTLPIGVHVGLAFDSGCQQRRQIAQRSTRSQDSAGLLVHAQLFGSHFDDQSLQRRAGHPHFVDSHPVVQEVSDQPGQRRMKFRWADLVPNVVRMS